MKIEEFKNVTIAYMRNIGEYGFKNEALMSDFKIYLRDHHLLGDTSIILGIALDHPEEIPAEKLRYDVGLIINEGTETGLNTRKIDDGSYAVYEVPHTKQGVMDFWKSLPQLSSGLSIDYSKPVIERYTMAKTAAHLCEFCIPLK